MQVHPGYGFLSENAHFVDELEKRNVIFIGPPASAINAMGDKIMSKKIAKDAGVNIIPGFEGEVENAEEAMDIAKNIGYPLMIKASAGGGGKGMRIVWNDKELKEAFRDCAAEASSSFGDSRLLMERYIQTSRHIEIQVLADSEGNVIWLPERECSIQRRNQKVLEEAPSPFMDDMTRKQMGEQAVSLCKAVGYRSAGTVEFLVDDKKNFYFLEMNTRLQVEHPITEYITKLDLVEEMIHIAAGKTLRITQDRASQIHGWALEARIYAERPSKDFLPSTGTLSEYVEPVSPGDATVRCDSGVEEGSEISIYYDPMISKLVTFGDKRNEALDRMTTALDRYVIRGLDHNISFCRDLISLPAFRSGDINTDFIKDHFPDGWKGVSLSQDEFSTVVAICAMLSWCKSALARFSSDTYTDIEEQVSVKIRGFGVEENGQDYNVRILPCKENTATAASWECRIMIGETEMAVEVPVVGCVPSKIAIVKVNDKTEYMNIIKRSSCDLDIQYKGADLNIKVQTPLQSSLQRYMPEPIFVDKSKLVRTPMPAALVKILVKAGDTVSIGDEIAIVEAMKMRNVLHSEVDAIVKSVPVSEGDVLPMDGVIAEFQ